jgi:hypothetical protein
MSLLNDMEWGNWSNVEIAKKAAVTEFLVRKIKGENPSSIKSKITDSNPEVTQEKQFTRNGKTYLMNTENIGKATQRRDGSFVEQEAQDEPEEEKKIIRSPIPYQDVRDMFEDPEDDDYDEDEKALPRAPSKSKPLTDEEAERLAKKALGSPEQQAFARTLLGTKTDDILISLNTALFDFNNKYEKYAFRAYEQLDRAEDYTVNLLLETINKAENFFAQFKQQLKIAGRKAR